MAGPAKRRPGRRRAATLGEVGRGLMNLPRNVWQVLIMPGFWLCALLMTLILVLYVLIPALLLDYLPGRLFGYYRGTQQLDFALAVVLFSIAGLVVWGKVKRQQEAKTKARREARLKEKLGMENQRLQAQVLAKLAEKGRLHPETGYAYREVGKNLEALGEKEQARKAYGQAREIIRETLGAAHPDANHFSAAKKEKVVIQPSPAIGQINPGVYDGPEIFDTKRTLISIFGIILGVSLMSAVIAGLGFGIELILSILK